MSAEPTKLTGKRWTAAELRKLPPKERDAIHLVAGIFCQRVLAESALRIGSLVDQSLPAFIGPGAGAEPNVAEVGGHEKVIMQNSSARTIG